MSVKWKPDGWETVNTGRSRIQRRVKYPIAGVSISDLEELANKSRDECQPIERKRRGKAIVELDKRRKIYGLSKSKTI